MAECITAARQLRDDADFLSDQAAVERWRLAIDRANSCLIYLADAQRRGLFLDRRTVERGAAAIEKLHRLEGHPSCDCIEVVREMKAALEAADAD